MRFNLAAFHDPERNGLYAIIATAVTIYFYAYSLTYGSIGILATYAVWLPLIAIKPRLLVPGAAQGFLFALPAFALISGIWADNPELSLRFGVQLMSTMVCAYLAARVVSTQNMMIGLIIGCMVTGGVALLDGTRGMAGETEYLIGWFGSKNQLGLVVSIGALAALIYPVIGSGSWATRTLTVIVAICFIWLLAQTSSVTSFISLSTGFGAFACLVAYRRLSPRVRSFVLPFIAAGLVILVSAALLAVPLADVFGLLGKSEDLSGRTGLWEAAIAAFWERPIVGYGYQGFWVEGRQAAELLWDAYDIPDKSGFHFHNALLQVLVDLGIVGITLFCVTTGFILWAQTKTVFGGRISRRTVVYLTFTAYFLSRMFSEIDFYYQFAIGTFLFYTMAFKVVRQAFGRRRSRSRRPLLRRAARSGSQAVGADRLRPTRRPVIANAGTRRNAPFTSSNRKHSRRP